jgi:tryptophanyl-tRNA synthetase
MAERNISGRSACKNKGSIIEKLIEFDANPEEPNEKVKKAPKEKPAKEEEEPLDEEVNKKVAELVNKLYKIKKHAKKQGSEFKNGFMDYINDLCSLVDDYQESNQ